MPGKIIRKEFFAMKKNRMMRLASSLLVLTLLTTCIISGTFAKYVTADEGSDTARVAKWGVTAMVSGSLFGENYVPNSTADDKNEISATVLQSVDTQHNDAIVAPGTQNTEGLTLAVTGKPEVANRIQVGQVEDEELKDIYLAKGRYGVLVPAEGVTADNYTDYYVGTPTGDATTYAKVGTGVAYDETGATVYYELHDEAEVTADKYYPVKWALTEKGSTAEFNIDTTAALMAAVGTKFNTGADQQNNAGVDLSKSYVITWKWDFDDNGNGTNDGADTILGNLIAAKKDKVDWVVVKEDTTTTGTYAAPVETTDYCLDVAFNVTLTVTQVD